MEEKRKPLPEKYNEVWQEFNRIKKEYEDLCQKSSIQARKSDQIAAELYNFVNTQLVGKYKPLSDTFATDIAKESNVEYQFWQLFYGIQAVNEFTKLLTLAIQTKKLNLSEETTGCKGAAESVRQLSNQVPGHKEIGWGSIKVGLVTALILGLIAGIMAAAILVNPAFLVFLVIPGAAAAWIIFSSIIEHGTKDSFLSNFYRTDFSKELDELADRIQNIIDGPDLGPVPVASQVPQSTSGSSFGSVYQPDPEGKEKPVVQSSVQTTPTKKSDS